LDVKNKRTRVYVRVIENIYKGAWMGVKNVCGKIEDFNAK